MKVEKAQNPATQQPPPILEKSSICGDAAVSVTLTAANILWVRMNEKW